MIFLYQYPIFDILLEKQGKNTKVMFFWNKINQIAIENWGNSGININSP